MLVRVLLRVHPTLVRAVLQLLPVQALRTAVRAALARVREVITGEVLLLLIPVRHRLLLRAVRTTQVVVRRAVRAGLIQPDLLPVPAAAVTLREVVHVRQAVAVALHAAVDGNAKSLNEEVYN